MLDAFCIVWLLTTTCADDRLAWNPPLDRPDERYIRLVYGGDTYTLPPGTTSHAVGCFDGTIRYTTLPPEWDESEPVFFRWEGVAGEDTLGAEATGRFMQWDVPFPHTSKRKLSHRCK